MSRPTSFGGRLRLVITLLLAWCAIAAGTVMAAGSASAATAPSRAMWVWSKANPTDVITFAQSYGVSRLFVAVPWNVAGSSDLPRLKQLSAAAGAAGIRVDALGGDPTWTTNPSAAVTWERGAIATHLFAGVHVDIEPYALSGWNDPSTQASLVTSYLSTLSSMRKTAAAAGMPLEADVPFWYNTIATGATTMADGVLARVDAVTVMSYRNVATGPNSITDIGSDMLARGAAAGVPVRLAAETNPLSDCPTCTFAGTSAATLDTALAAVDSTEAGSSSYAGMAVEDYDGWRALPATA